jgi:flagellar hook-basal body complex protein FliE
MATDPINGKILGGIGDKEVLGSKSIASPESGGDGFDRLLDETIGRVNALQKEAEEALKALTGGGGDVVQAMVSMQKAEISFQTMVEVRNKLVRAYEDIIRMQV